jgi:hypothetical protein
MMVRKLLLFLSIFTFFIVDARSNGTIENLIECDPGTFYNLVRSTVCANTTETYTAEFTYDGECEFFYNWTIEGGEFVSNNDSLLSGGNLHSVDVQWFENASCHKISFESTNALEPGDSGLGESLCKDEEMVTESGYLYPIITGDANQLPALSTWYFEGKSDGNSLICSDNGTIAATESKPDSNNYIIETKLSYQEPDGEVIVIKDWSSVVLKGEGSYPFTPTYENLHTRIKFIKQSRYANCTSINDSEEFEIDFYLIPDFNLIDSSQPQCAGEIATATFSLSNTKLSSVIIGLTRPQNGLISFEIEAENDSVFTISDTLSVKLYDPTEQNYENV